MRALQMGLSPNIETPTSAHLKTELAGLSLPNPVGLAAGFDKNATVIDPLLRSGFGFIEIGGVTPRPQTGNPKPRLFRLSEDRAVINRFGFNNDGMQAITPRLAARQEPGIVGVNLGANKDSDDKAKDFQTVLAHCGAHADFATVNVSSPNTEKLRDLQGKEALTALLSGVMDTNASLSKPIPIFLKVAPDLDEPQIDDIVEVALSTKINAIFATNTTLARDGLKSPHAAETGGLSGKPLMEPSTKILSLLSARLNGEIPLVGIGGISSAEDAQRKLDAGATAVQLYSALVFEGISLAAKIARGLDKKAG